MIPCRNAKSVWHASSSVRFDSGEMKFIFGKDRIRIGATAFQSVLFVCKQHTADRVARLVANLFQSIHHFHRVHASRTIILRAITHIP